LKGVVFCRRGGDSRVADERPGMVGKGVILLEDRERERQTY
jgi:hypothetical protein